MRVSKSPFRTKKNGLTACSYSSPSPLVISCCFLPFGPSTSIAHLLTFAFTFTFALSLSHLLVLLVPCFYSRSMQTFSFCNIPSILYLWNFSIPRLQLTFCSSLPPLRLLPPLLLPLPILNCDDISSMSITDFILPGRGSILCIYF